MPDEELPVPPPPAKGFQLSNTVIIGGLFAIAAALAVQEFMGSEGLEPGHTAPEVTLTKLDGSAVALSSSRGKVVLLNFWATWCPPCNEEMPELVAIAKEYEARGVVFIAVNQEEPGEARSSIPPWLVQHADVKPYVVIGDESVGGAFLVQALPTTYVLDAKGRVVKVARGQVEGWRVKKWLDDALAAQ